MYFSYHKIKLFELIRKWICKVMYRVKKVIKCSQIYASRSMFIRGDANGGIFQKNPQKLLFIYHVQYRTYCNKGGERPETDSLDEKHEIEVGRMQEGSG